MGVRPAERLILKVLDPAMALMRVDSVTEVLLNGDKGAFFEDSGKLHRAAFTPPDSQQLGMLLKLIAQVAGRVLHDEDFELDTILDGPPALRVHANYGPTSPQGICLSLRKLSKTALTLEILRERYSAITGEAAEYLRQAVLTHRNIVISGGTGSGKTSLLNALAQLAPTDERIVVIEDTQEIGLIQPDVVSLITRRADEHGRGEVTIRDLFRSALRMRPDRLIIGEVRGGEAFDLIQALGSGHAGSLTTIHADSPSLALNRMHALAMQSGIPVPSDVLRTQISEVVALVVQIARLPGGARKVERIEKLEASDGSVWQLEPIFRLHAAPGEMPALQRVASGQ